LISVFKKRKLSFNKGIAFFILFLIIQLLISTNLPSSFYGFVKIIEFTFFAVYVSSVFVAKEKIVLLFLFPFVFESLLSIWQFLSKGSIGSIFYFFGERAFNGQTPGIANASINGELFLRPYGTFSHPNVLAGFLLICFTLLVFSHKKINFSNLLILLVGALAIILTLSRVSILLLFFVVFGKLFFFLIKKMNRLNFSLFVLVILLSISYIIFFSPISERFFISLSEQSFLQRKELFEVGIKMFWQSPIIGIGLNNFLSTLPSYLSQQKVLFIQPVHNIYLLTLSQLGLVGFIFLFYLLSLATKRIIKNKNFLLLVLLAEILFIGFFDHYPFTLQQGQLLFTLLIGFSFSKTKFKLE
jgi:O-antigen ligase